MRNPFTLPRARRLLRLAHLFVVLPLVVGCLIFFRPAFVLVTGCSMCPTYSPGDFVITRVQASYHPGEIIAYHVPAPDPAAGRIVIHRITGGDGNTGFTMEGDHNQSPDPWHPKQGDILGTSAIRLPNAGGILLTIRSPALIAALASTIVFCFIAFQAPTFRRETRIPLSDPTPSTPALQVRTFRLRPLPAPPPPLPLLGSSTSPPAPAVPDPVLLDLRHTPRTAVPKALPATKPALVLENSPEESVPLLEPAPTPPTPITRLAGPGTPLGMGHIAPAPEGLPAVLLPQSPQTHLKKRGWHQRQVTAASARAHFAEQIRAEFAELNDLLKDDSQ